MTVLDRILQREELVVVTNYAVDAGTIYTTPSGDVYRITRQKVYPTAPWASWHTYGVRVGS